MADPFTIAAFAVIGGLQAVSSISAANAAKAEGEAANAAAERAAQIDERNKILVDQDRRQALDAARIDAEELRRDNRRRLASMRAQYGASGLEFSGSPLEVLSDASTEFALDERRTEYQGYSANREAGLRMIGLQESADSQRAAGLNAKSAAKSRATGYLLSGASNVAKTAYSGYQNYDSGA